ncbi:MAG: hypothetical protein IJS52_03450 [Bacilli bacterium]|nr:hypothetical protein [Bacilli bacterium]
MGKDRYSTVREQLESAGLVLDSFSTSLFGVKVLARFPLGEKHLTLELQYSSFHRVLHLELNCPYSPADKALEAEYDRQFPKEKGKIGRSTPVFEQAIVDYMRGQSRSSNLIELRDHKRVLHIELTKGAEKRGEDGFLEALELLRFELCQGAMHEDVLTHMFAF